MKITKAFTIFGLSLMAMNVSIAQVSIKGGVNFASFSEKPFESNIKDYKSNSVVGWQGGLAFNVPVGSVVSIQPEVLYIQKGGKSQFVVNENNQIVRERFVNYVEIPVLLKLNFGSQNSTGVGVYIDGGPYLGLGISGKVKTSTTIAGVTTVDEKKVSYSNDSNSERQSRADFGLSFGGGIKVSRVTVDLRYNLGINNILDSDANNSNDNNPYLRNRGIGLTLGYQF